jgi:predicted metal-dependent hydrolase
MKDEQINLIFQKRKGAKRITMTLLAGNIVRVSVPYRYPLFLAKQYVKKQESVIQKLQERREARRQIFLMSSPHLAKLITTHTKEEVKKYKEDASTLVQTLLALHRDTFATLYQKVMIKDMRSRWGSCSSRGTLTFHYKILFLPPHLAEYLIVHELCHLLEMNHSSRFWKKVEKHIPLYEVARRELRAIPCSF